jgi:folate-dependent phosphoribosylglycinamide formyltransferase PurN
MRAIVLTSTMRRHAFVANALASRLEVAGVWQEAKSFEPLRYATSADDEAVINRHFAARDASEAEFFADHERVRVRAVRLPPGGCNQRDVVDAMRQTGADIVLVFGTGLLRGDVIDAFPGQILNVHLGLSPFYRGAGTNFWPLVNREPELCGATIHVLDHGVDSGPIITHVRPEIRRGDGPHEIGNRIIVAAVDALAAAAIAHAASPLPGVVQSGEGRVYKRADFSAAAVRLLYANVAEGMIGEYLDDRAARDAAVPLVVMEARAS